MLLKAIAKLMGLNTIFDAGPDVDITCGYASDLLSDVLAKATGGAIWVTNQKHQNIIGVAVMLNLAGVIIAGGINPDENTIEKAVEEKIPLYTTDMSLFELVAKLYALGIKSC